MTAQLPARPVGVPDSPAPGLPGLPGIPSLPQLQGFPTVPSEPTVPALPGLPELPGLPTLPVHTLPIHVTPAPQPGLPSTATAPTTSSAMDARGGQRSEGRSDTAMPLAYGPPYVAGTTVTQAVAHLSAHRVGRSVFAPVRQAPTQGPGGALGGKSGLDTGSSRHGGNAHAVTFDHRAPLSLVPGAAAGVDADGTRDRHRDIPVSPA
ncbi:hypothetical protein M2271_001418 [Streptomyces sp. LBL]|uniref:hypothetical protein n=1 Tax=Streptomyces sp. LBL TaxID=2940562 RepID=UPI00247310CF|nr:hypothetical protein [Streptomyces sp. LBL]MDH6623626.1 hypothetical protein [Streptomyces sp. LBL]